MLKHNLDDTIAAISTPLGDSGIGIVRLSGKDAIKVADKIFLPKDGKKPSTFKTYTVHYGWVVDLDETTRQRPQGVPSAVEGRVNESTKIIDEVILTIMRAPKSYTKEDVVEINCHGGIVALRAVLDLVLANDCRLSEPGEFTKRAFLNGRIDLAQAEAVLDIIRAKTDSALKLGTDQLRGGLSRRINHLSQELLGILAALEASIDFPDEEIGPADPKGIRKRLNGINDELKDILDSSKHGRIIREGIQVVICGKPNVGKSSLLNALLKQERSIVTPVAGTTRDTIEEVIDIKGVPIRIVDTAGIIEPRDLVEKQAVLRSKRYINLADLVILVFDGSKQFSRQDLMLIKKLTPKPIIAVINKIDLRQHISREKLAKKFKYVVEISAKKLKNISGLEQAIVDFIFSEGSPRAESIMVSRRRHIEAIRGAQKFVEETLNSLDNSLSLEFVAADIKEALAYLDEISGRKFSEGLLDRIFSEFCIGK